MGHHVSDTLLRGQKNLSKKIIAEGNIASVEKGVELVTTTPVEQDEVLLMIMSKVIDQHNIIIMARCIVDKDENKSREEHLVNEVVGEIALSRSEEEIDHSPRFIFRVLIMTVFDAHDQRNIPFSLLLLGHHWS